MLKRKRQIVATGEMKTATTLIVLGSGGHTMEILEVVQNLDKNKYTPRHYILASSDKLSKDKTVQIEDSDYNYTFSEILRSRHVNQSYFAAIFTTVLSFVFCIPLVWRLKPNVIICNGPGTCIPVCIAAYFLRLLRINRNCKIVYIESYCRVKTLSLSGKILQYFADMFVVQWPCLVKSNKNVKYFGRLV